MDGTPDYLFTPGVAERIKRTFPEAKILVTLCDPAYRALSQYRMYRYLDNYGFSARPHLEPTFREAIDALPSEHMVFDYRELGHYATQLQTWKHLFPRHQLLIVYDFFRDGQGTMDMVADFLNLTRSNGNIMWSNRGVAVVDRLEDEDWAEMRSTRHEPSEPVPNIKANDLDVVKELNRHYTSLL